MPSSDRVLRASEIGEYVFCHRAWWLHRVQELESANRAQMEAGTVKHVEHGRAVRHADTMQRAAIILFAIAIILALMFCLTATLPTLD
ncbi:MAG: hypothetical protein HZB51_24055 [Chloroflexi bacterium]|nr:hypothetical protein [Chloroflexota bacterium]